MRKYFLQMLVSLLISTSLCYAQNTYFWNGKDKVDLKVDSTEVLIKVKERDDVNKLINKINQSDNRTEVKEISIGGQVFILAKKFDKKKQNISKEEIDYQIPVFYNENTPYYFNGNVILRPKKGINLDKIKWLVNNEMIAMDSTSSGTFFYKAKRGDDILNISNKISESGLVEFCHPDFLAQIVKHLTPADPNYDHQYYLNNTGQFGGTAGIDINAPEAWDITRGCNTVRIAVIDDGVETHPDLTGRVLPGFTALIPNGNGAPNNVCFDADPNDPNNPLLRVGHGMACTGIIAASHNNLGVAGIAPNSLIYPVNIFVGGETVADLITSINRAWNPAFGNADIISNSWGFRATTGPAGIAQEITDARTLGRVRNGVTLGCIVIFSSGNSNPVAGCLDCFNGVAFPGNVNGVITVGAIDNVGNIHGYSSRGSEMDVVAPSGGANGVADLGGCQIPTGNVRTIDRAGANGYAVGDFFDGFNGTSAAAPQVSGVAALMISANPRLTEAQVRTILQQTATDMGSGGFDNTFGFGRVNAFTAVKAAINNAAVAGPNHICPSATFSVSNLPAGFTVAWSSSNTSAVTITSGGVATRVGSYNGSVTITATINGGCTNIVLTKTLTVGIPNLVKTINGTVAGTTPVTAGNMYNLNATSNSTVSTTFNYNNYYGTGNMTIDLYSPNSPATQMYVYSTSTSGSRHVRVTVTNTCGSYYEDFVFYLMGGSMMAYPNPATDLLTLEFVNAEISESLPEKVELYSEGSSKSIKTILIQDIYKNKAFKDGNKVELDVSNLPRGTYYLHVIPGKGQNQQIEKTRILLK